MKKFPAANFHSKVWTFFFWLARTSIFCHLLPKIFIRHWHHCLLFSPFWQNALTLHSETFLVFEASCNITMKSHTLVRASAQRGTKMPVSFQLLGFLNSTLKAAELDNTFRCGTKLFPWFEALFEAGLNHLSHGTNVTNVMSLPVLLFREIWPSAVKAPLSCRLR